MLIFSAKLFKSLHNILFERIHLPSKLPEVFKANQLQTKLRKCLTINEIQIVINENEKQLLEYGKTILLQFLNEFYVDPNLKRYNTSLQSYKFLQKFQNLTLYELTLKYSISQKLLVVRNKFGEELIKIRKETRQKMIKIYKDKENSLDIIDAFNLLIASRQPQDVNLSLIKIQKDLLKTSQTLYMKKLYNIFVKKLLHFNWDFLRNYPNIINFITFEVDYLNKIPISNQIQIVTTICRFQLHLVTQKKLIPPVIDFLFDKVPQNFQNISYKNLLLIYQCYKYLPLTYRRDFFNKISHYLIEVAPINTYSLTVLPFNKLNQQIINKIITKLIDNQQEKAWHQGVYIFHIVSLKNYIFNNQKYLKFVENLFLEKFRIEKFKNRDDFSRYLGFGMILYEKFGNKALGKSGRSISSIIIEIFDVYHSKKQFLEKEKLEDNLQENQEQLSPNQTKPNQWKIFQFLSQINILNFLIFLLTEGKREVFNQILQNLPYLLKKRKSRQLYNNYQTQLIQALQWHISCEMPDIKKILNILLLNWLNSDRNQVQTSLERYFNQINFYQFTIPLPKLNGKNFKIYSQIIFIIQRKPTNNSYLHQLSKQLISQFKNQCQILLIQYYILYLNKTQYLTQYLLNYFLSKNYQYPRFLFKNILIFITNVSLKFIKSFKGTIATSLQEYLKQIDLGKEFKLLPKGSINLEIAYNCFRVLINFHKEDYIRKFCQQFFMRYLKIFPLPQKLIEDEKLSSKSYKLSYDYKSAYCYLMRGAEMIMQHNKSGLFNQKRIQKRIGQIQQQHLLGTQIVNKELFQKNILMMSQKIIIILNQLEDFLYHQNIQDNRKISSYYQTKKFEINVLLQPLTSYPEKQKDLDQILSELAKDTVFRDSQQNRAQTYLILLKLHTVGKIQIQDWQIIQFLNYLNQSIQNHKFGFTDFLNCLPAIPTGLQINTQIIKKRFLKYLFPFIELLLKYDKTKKNPHIYEYLLIMLTKGGFDQFQTRQLNFNKIITILLEQSLNNHLQTFSLIQLIRIVSKLKITNRNLLESIKRQIKHNSDYVRSYWKQIYFIWNKIFYQIPQADQQFIWYVKKNVEDIFRNDLIKIDKMKKQINKVNSQQNKLLIKKFSYILGRYINYLWCCIKNDNTKNQIFEKLSLIFLEDIEIKLQQINNSQYLISLYRQVYYYIFHKSISQNKIFDRNKNIQKFLIRTKEEEIYPNPKLEDLLNKRGLTFQFKKHINKRKDIKNNNLAGNNEQISNNLGFPYVVDYYLPEKQQIIIILRGYHKSQSNQLTGHLLFQKRVIKQCVNRNILVYDSQTKVLSQ